MPPTPEAERLLSDGPPTKPVPAVPSAELLRRNADAMNRIPTIMSAQELIDSTFHRAAKIAVWLRDSFERFRATEIARVRSVQNSLDSTLERYVRRFPSFDHLPPFYRDLADLLIDVDRTKQSLGALDWARKQIVEIGDEAAAEMKGSKREDVILNAKSQAYGRIASVLKQVDRHLRSLDAARNEIRRLPVIDTTVPTIVVAGFPNVGKSSLIREVSTAEPEIANYPFTTKGVAVGHFEVKRERYQIVDTPGLLDREIEQRNAIELQAVLALKHLGDVIVFMLDPSEYCGFPIADQEKLLKETKRLFPDTPILVAENKVDLKRPPAQAGRFQISTETGEGVDVLMDRAVETVRERRGL